MTTQLFDLDEVDNLAFHPIGAVCLRGEQHLSRPPGNAQMVAVSSRFGLVVFADSLGA